MRKQDAACVLGMGCQTYAGTPDVCNIHVL